MKVVLIFLCVFLSLLAGAQTTSPVVCRGKPLSITLLPGPKMTGPSLPLRFGGTREFPRSPFHSFKSDKAFRLVIKSRDEFSEFWKQLLAPVPPDQWPPLPEIDFAKEMIVVSAMGEKPTPGYWTIIDGACEVDGQVEVFVTNVDNDFCSAFPVVSYPADAVRIPRSDLPVVFRETQLSCREWMKRVGAGLR